MMVNTNSIFGGDSLECCDGKQLSLVNWRTGLRIVATAKRDGENWYAVDRLGFYLAKLSALQVSRNLTIVL
jgi:hypothetical protein